MEGNYSADYLYTQYGQYDKIVTVTIKPETDSRAVYGSQITGVFIYTKQERISFEERLKPGIPNSPDGKVRIEELLQSIPEKHRISLEKTGIPVSDILCVFSLDNNKTNQFKAEDIRTLSYPKEIRIDASGFDPDDLTLKLNNDKLKKGYTLTPFERNEHNSILYERYRDQISKDDISKYFINPETGKIKNEIIYSILYRRFKKETISDSEFKEFLRLRSQRMEERIKIIERELERGGFIIKKLGPEYSQQIEILYRLAFWFEPETLLFGKLSVWWDFERFIHIYLLHVSEVKLKRSFQNKTNFQYMFEDIKNLIEHVLNLMNDKIQEYFQRYPKRDLHRRGEMGFYYNGDYYNMHIASNGRLMTFHKQRIIKIENGRS